MWNISNIWAAGKQMMQNIHVELNPGLHGKSSIQEEEVYSLAD
jgi:hypothetical protein